MCLCRYLAADHDGAHGVVLGRVLLDAVVERDDVKDVEQLSFVLVDPLHLDVEHGRRVDTHPKLPLDVRRQLHLVLLTFHSLNHTVSNILHVSLVHA